MGRSKLDLALDEIITSGYPAPRKSPYLVEEPGNGSRRIFVGNLAYRTSWQDLKDHFRPLGTVVHTKILEDGGKGSGRSKGCGIVEFSKAAEAARAMEEMHDTELGGRKITVREDREDKEARSIPQGPSRPSSRVAAAVGGGGGGGDGGGGGGGGGGVGGGGGGGSTGALQGRRLYVSNIAFSTSWQALKDHFRTIGNVVHAKIMEEGGKGSGRSKGCGIVEFARTEDAARAMVTLNNLELDGRCLNVREDREDHEVQEQVHNDDRRVGSAWLPASEAAKTRPAAEVDDGVQLVGRRLFVSNLAFSTSWQDLKDHFRQVGEVSHSKLLEHADGRPKGAGIVEFVSSQHALLAIGKLDGSTLGGRQIGVRVDHQDRDLMAGVTAVATAPAAAPQRKRGRSPPVTTGAPQGTGMTSLFVSNLAYSTSWQQLKDHCRSAGRVTFADVMREESGRSRGYGVVQFATEAEAAEAVRRLHDTELDGRPIAVRFEQEKAKRVRSAA